MSPVLSTTELILQGSWMQQRFLEKPSLAFLFPLFQGWITCPLHTIRSGPRRHNMMPAKKSNATNSSFNDDDRQQLKEIHQTTKNLVNEMRDLKSELAQNKEELKEIKMENAKLKQTLNVNILSTNAIDQYGRRTNIRIYGVPENTTEKDDGEEIVKEITMELSIKLPDWGVQRAHRLGSKRPNSARKPRPTIARFVNYKTRNKSM